jgi:uncharacterized protein
LKLNLTSIAQYPAPLRIGLLMLVLLLLWLPFAIPIYALVTDPNLVNLLTMPVLYLEFIFLLKFWGRKIYRCPNLLQSYGLELTRQNGKNLLIGLVLGSLSVILIFLLQVGLGWLTLATLSPRIGLVIVEGLLIALLLGFAEELLFRGWLLDELERDYTPNAALGINSSIFALAHFIKPVEVMQRMWFAFPSLVLLGIALIWAKQASPSLQNPQQRLLGLPIGLHGGLFWGYYIINVGQLVEYTNSVPEWITGIDRNPLSGIIGFLFMGATALLMRRKAKAVKPEGV